jgi:hypothetical protein
VQNGYWNYTEPIEYRVIVVKLLPVARPPLHWQNAFVGQQRQVVEVFHNGHTFLIDNMDGSGLKKIEARGGPDSMSRYIECPRSVNVVFNADSLPAGKPDTACEWMHISMTRGKGFVVARKALSVRVGGICTTHLDCAGKPFPEHYHVGWCQGKESLFNRLVKGRGR